MNFHKALQKRCGVMTKVNILVWSWPVSTDLGIARDKSFSWPLNVFVAFERRT